MRSQYLMKLESLDEELVKMGAMCEESIASATYALLQQQPDLLETTLENYRLIHQKGRDVENLCMKLLLREQPVASDLRRISSALKIVYDMSRISDQASEIAQIILQIDSEKVLCKEAIKAMAEDTLKMVTNSIDAFVKKDLDLSQSVVSSDDVIDQSYVKIKKNLIQLLSENQNDAELCVDLLLITKYLERIADHACNIAKWVVYTITGKIAGEQDDLYFGR